MNARPPSADEVAALAAELAEQSAETILARALERFAPRLAISTAFGASGLVVIHLAQRLKKDIPVFTLDTGYLFPETLALKDQLVREWGLNLIEYHPEQTVAEQDAAHGPELFRRDPDRCCALRKVEPLERALVGMDAWITGIRRAQSVTRRDAKVLELDPRGVVKVQPLAGWTDEDVKGYLFAHDVPYNPLHDRGFPSIGCTPCTRAIRPGEDSRAGRWADAEKTECGLHLPAQGGPN